MLPEKSTSQIRAFQASFRSSVVVCHCHMAALLAKWKFSSPVTRQLHRSNDRPEDISTRVEDRWKCFLIFDATLHRKSDPSRRRPLRAGKAAQGRWSGARSFSMVPFVKIKCPSVPWNWVLAISPIALWAGQRLPIAFWRRRPKRQGSHRDSRRAVLGQERGF